MGQKGIIRSGSSVCSQVDTGLKKKSILDKIYQWIRVSVRDVLCGRDVKNMQDFCILNNNAEFMHRKKGQKFKMNYTAVIGDIKNSKQTQNRSQIQKKLNAILDHINETYQTDISAKFIITLGDEFQGLLENNNHLLDIIKYIQQELYPVKLRFGIGIGEINTNILHDAAIGADGPAYYAARKTIQTLRIQEKKLKRQAADIQISIYNTENFEITQINLIFSFLKMIEDGWSEKQRFTIWDMQQHGGSQKECAKRMNTTQSTIARRLADGNYLTYERTKKIVHEALMRLENIINDN